MSKGESLHARPLRGGGTGVERRVASPGKLPPERKALIPDQLELIGAARENASRDELGALVAQLALVNRQLMAKICELEKARDDLANFVASTNIATIFVDCRMRLRRFTPEAAKVLRLAAADLGRPLADIAERLGDPNLMCDAEAVVEGLAGRRRELRTADGRWYLRDAQPYWTRDGRVEGMVVTLSDQAADVVREARLYAESIVDTVREALLVVDAELRVRSANRSFYELFDTSPKETEGRALAELGNGQWNSPILLGLLGDVLTRGELVHGFEVEHELERIGRRNMLLSARRVERGIGRPPLILLAIDDVTERRRQEEALRRSEEDFRLVFDQSPIGAAVVSLDRRFLRVNGTLCRMTGYDREELLGRSASEVLGGATSAGEPEGDRPVAAGDVGECDDVEERIRRKNGETIWVRHSAWAVRDPSGGAAYVLHMLQDVTERRRAEHTARQRLVELARVLRLSTVSELTSGLAHEVSQPLSAVVNDLAACSARLGSGKARRETLVRLLEHASAQALRAGEIVQHLRKFVQGGEAELEALDLRDVVSGALDLARPELERLRVDLRVDLGGRPVPVLVDRIQVEQVVINLLQNAVEATLARSRGEARKVEVSTARGAGDTAVFAVCDQGGGVSEALLEKVFSPFFTTKPHGLGMGLAISRSIIETHRGRLWLDRQGGRRGTTACFALPLAGLEAATASPAAAERR